MRYRTMALWMFPALIVAALVFPAAGSAISWRLVEGSRPGQTMGNIFTESGLRDKHSAKKIAAMRLRFLAKPKLPFALDEESGVVTTSGVVDRDQLCPYAVTCKVRLDVATFPVQSLEIIKIEVEIVDTNDNYPTFRHPRKRLEYRVSESAEPGVTFAVPPAVDPDSPGFSIQRYELMPPTSKFALEFTPSPEGITDVRLRLRGQLDREEKARYSMKVIAVDGGSPPKTGELEVRIKVLDANDNNPIFNKSKYDVSIKENLPVHSTVLRVQARDPDFNNNGQILYNFTTRSQNSYGHLFGINELTGDIFTKAAIDFETGSIYHLGVTARDRGPNSMPADATVVVRVIDENDHKPEISLSTIAASHTSRAEVPENAEKGTFVAQVKVTDQDSGRNARFTCQLNDRNFFLKKLEEPGAYQIVTMETFDREDRSLYNVQLMCEDEGEPTQVSIKHIHILVLDENDNPPYFKRSKYSTNVVENNFVHARVVTVNATDADAGVNGHVTYSLPDKQARELFDVDEVTGVITAKVMLDREVLPRVEFQVIAEDHGKPPLSAVTTVIVNIYDVNDEAPQFNAESYNFVVSENEPAHVRIGDVMAVDRDAPPSNDFEYSFIPTFLATHNFDIHPRTGVISTRRMFDRERLAAYHLMVVATDKGSPPLSSSVSVTVTVADQNDHPPEILYPTPRNNSLQVSSMAPVGHVIAWVRARDRDAGVNSQLVYTITGGNDRELFRMDAQRGSISIAQDISKYEYGFNELRLVVQDRGAPVRTAHAFLNVAINSSIPHLQPAAGAGDDVMVVVGVVSGAAVIAGVLVIAIVIVCKKGQNQHKNNHYNCRTEEIKMLDKNGLAQDIDDHAVVIATPVKTYPTAVPAAEMPNGVILTGSGDIVNTMSLEELQRTRSRDTLSKSRDTLSRASRDTLNDILHDATLPKRPPDKLLSSFQPPSPPPQAPAYPVKIPPAVPPKPSYTAGHGHHGNHSQHAHPPQQQQYLQTRSLHSPLPHPPSPQPPGPASPGHHGSASPSGGGVLSTLQRQWSMTARELEHNTLLRKMREAGGGGGAGGSLDGGGSDHSGEGSGTDSGHGPSEEGDHRHSSVSPMPPDPHHPGPPHPPPADPDTRVRREDQGTAGVQKSTSTSTTSSHSTVATETVEDKHRKIAALQRQYTLELTSSLSVESVSSEEASAQAQEQAR